MFTSAPYSHNVLSVPVLMEMSIHVYTRINALELFGEAEYGSREDTATIRGNIQAFTDQLQGQTAAQTLHISYRRLSPGDFRTLVYRVVARLWAEELRNSRE